MRSLPLLLLTLVPVILSSSCTAPEKITAWSEQSYTLLKGVDALEAQFPGGDLMEKTDTVTEDVFIALKQASEQVYQHALYVERISARAGDAKKQAAGLQKTYTNMAAFLSASGQAAPALLLAGELGRVLSGEIRTARAEKLLHKVLTENSVLLEDMANLMLHMTSYLRQVSDIEYAQKEIQLENTYAPYLNFIALQRYREKETLRQLNTLLSLPEAEGADSLFRREESLKQLYARLSKTQSQIRAYDKKETAYQMEKEELYQKRDKTALLIHLLEDAIQKHRDTEKNLLQALAENKKPDFTEMQQISSRLNTLIDKLASDED